MEFIRRWKALSFVRSRCLFTYFSPSINMPLYLFALFASLFVGGLCQNFTSPCHLPRLCRQRCIFGPDQVYHFSTSSFQCSAGALIVKSYDFVNWAFMRHSIPMLDCGPGYNMSGTPNWVGGIRASTIRYRKSNNKWYLIGCVNLWETHICIANKVTGLCGLLIDDDDTIYVVNGNTNVNVS